MVSDKNTIIQVVISKNLLQLIRKYCEISGISISSFCGSAISEKVVTLFMRDEDV